MGWQLRISLFFRLIEWNELLWLMGYELFWLPHYAYISLSKKLRVGLLGYSLKCGLYFLTA